MADFRRGLPRRPANGIFLARFLSRLLCMPGPRWRPPANGISRGTSSRGPFACPAPAAAILPTRRPMGFLSPASSRVYFACPSPAAAILVDGGQWDFSRPLPLASTLHARPRGRHLGPSTANGISLPTSSRVYFACPAPAAAISARPGQWARGGVSRAPLICMPGPLCGHLGRGRPMRLSENPSRGREAHARHATHPRGASEPIR